MVKIVNLFVVFILFWFVFIGCSNSGDAPLFGEPSTDNTFDGAKEETNAKGFVYETLGEWPQTKKEESVSVDTKCEQKTVGDFTYYKGSDSAWYLGIEEKKADDNKPDDEISYKWFKVEPIKWRVLSAEYDHDKNNSSPGVKFLLAENVIIGQRYDNDNNNYENSEIRNWLNDVFLKTAFTTEEHNIIVTTIVDNSARTANPDENEKQWNSGLNPYASDIPCNDKVFLLSEQEVTKKDYGFDIYNKYVGCGDGTSTSSRIHYATDYAKQLGVNQNSIFGPGSWWWLRSPCYSDVRNARIVGSNGCVPDNILVSCGVGGVVPALCVTK